MKRKNFNALPIALTGCGLGFSTLTNGWKLVGDNFGQNINWITYIGQSFLVIFVLLMLIKYFITPKQFVSESKTNVVGSLIPTLFMALFSFSSFLKSFNIHWLPEIIWLGFMVIFLIYIFWFMIFQFKNWKWENIMACWFVVWVGIVVFCVSSPNMGRGMPNEQIVMNIFRNISQIVWYFGFTGYCISLPFILFRVLFVKPKVNKEQISTFGIFAAPPSLLLTGYLTTFNKFEIRDHNNIFLYILIPLAIIMTITVYIIMTITFRSKFKPLNACFTFPLAISFVAMIKISTHLFEINNGLSEFFKWLAIFEGSITTIVIFYVTFGLVIFSLNKLFFLDKKVSNKFINYFI